MLLNVQRKNCLSTVRLKRIDIMELLIIFIFSADTEYVQAEWQQEFNSWKSGDVVGWRSAFDQHLKETEGCGDGVNSMT